MKKDETFWRYKKAFLDDKGNKLDLRQGRHNTNGSQFSLSDSFMSSQVSHNGFRRNKNDRKICNRDDGYSFEQEDKNVLLNKLF